MGGFPKYSIWVRLLFRWCRCNRSGGHLKYWLLGPGRPSSHLTGYRIWIHPNAHSTFGQLGITYLSIYAPLCSSTTLKTMSELTLVGPWITEEYWLSADICWSMSDERILQLADPWMMELMAEHYVLFKWSCVGFAANCESLVTA